MGKKEDDARYYLKNKEKIKSYLKKYYLKNKEKIKKRSFEYNQKNKSNILLRNKIHYMKNRDKINYKNKIWNINNKERVAEYIKSYNIKRRKEDINFNLRHKLRSRLNIVMKKYGKGKDFPSSKYGIDYSKIINHLKPFPKDIKKYHIDHIRPLCSFDLSDNKQILNAFAPKNHQWLLIKDNLKKGGKTEWVNL